MLKNNLYCLYQKPIPYTTYTSYNVVKLYIISFLSFLNFFKINPGSYSSVIRLNALFSIQK